MFLVMVGKHKTDLWLINIRIFELKNLGVRKYKIPGSNKYRTEMNVKSTFTSVTQKDIMKSI